VVAMSKDASANYHHRLHALDITTGGEQFAGPVEVHATYPGSGVENTFSPKQHKERPGLLIANGLVYTAWSSHCDAFPYTSWMISYNETTLAQVNVLNLTPNGNDGALWNAGAGPAADGSGNVYVLTGNGTFDTTLNGSGFPSNGDYGNAFVKNVDRWRQSGSCRLFHHVEYGIGIWRGRGSRVRGTDTSSAGE